MLYHEKQVAALCGVHTLNTLLQGPYFNELDLAQIGHELDQLERQMLDGGEAAAAGNLDDSGMFSVQVLEKALQVWGLTAVPTDSKELREGGFDPQGAAAFICNLQEHWFTIRRVDGEYYNFNSLYPAPELLSGFYLTAYLDSLKDKGYTIFVVQGELPAAAAGGGGDLDGPGRWWSPEEARAAHQDAQAGRRSGRMRNAVEGAFERAAASGGTLTLRPANKRQLEDDGGSDGEDGDLAAAIAASMRSFEAAGGSGAGGAGAASYAAAARRGGAAAGFGAAHSNSGGGDNDDDDDDPELAAALAASLEQHQQEQDQQEQDQQQQLRQRQRQRQRQDEHQEQEQEQQRQQELEGAVEVPEEPPPDAPGALLLGFRLPSGGRLSRRFSASDTVAAARAWVAAQLVASGEARPGQSVELSTQFPKRLLGDPGQQLGEAGVEDRSMLSVVIGG